MGRLTFVAVIAFVAAVGLAAPPAVAAVEVDWGRPSATSTYGERIVFEQPASVPAGLTRVEVLMETPGALGPLVTPLPAPNAGQVTLRHSLELAEGHILPNTTLTVRWRVTAADGSEATGPPVSVVYEDTRFSWNTRQGDVVRVHWYAGSDAFGNRALEIGERAVRETAELLGVSEDEPVDFFVYADQDEFYEALGPGTRENVGGQANAEIRTLFALITPGEIDDPWVGVVIPHELVHLVFDTAVDNPYHFPPRWLNEGIAVYLSEGYGGRDRGAVEDAARNGTLIPLEGLTGQFPTTRDRFFLAYAESVSAVDFLIRAHGQDALVQLVRSYATGLTDDEAFEQAIGMDVAAFDAAWREELDAQDPIEFGPQPAPAGPLPPGWTTAEGSPGATLPPRPDGGGDPAAPLPGPDGGASTPLIASIALGVVVFAALLFVAWSVVRQRRRAEQAQLARWAAWREERDATWRPPAARELPPAARELAPPDGDLPPPDGEDSSEPRP